MAAQLHIAEGCSLAVALQGKTKDSSGPRLQAGGETGAGEERSESLNRQLLSSPSGYAIQTRVNMEFLSLSPSKTSSFLPSAGEVVSLFEPPSGPGVRVDTYAFTGYR